MIHGVFVCFVPGRCYQVVVMLSEPCRRPISKRSDIYIIYFQYKIENGGTIACGNVTRTCSSANLESLLQPHNPAQPNCSRGKSSFCCQRWSQGCSTRVTLYCPVIIKLRSLTTLRLTRTRTRVSAHGTF